jgi:hypothetical protein
MANSDDKAPDNERKTAGESAAAKPGGAATSAAPERPIARSLPGRRWLTSNERETLRGRLQKRFH